MDSRKIYKFKVCRTNGQTADIVEAACMEQNKNGSLEFYNQEGIIFKLYNQTSWLWCEVISGLV